MTAKQNSYILYKRGFLCNIFFYDCENKRADSLLKITTNSFKGQLTKKKSKKITFYG
jgi:hypothetical protein